MDMEGDHGNGWNDEDRPLPRKRQLTQGRIKHSEVLRDSTTVALHGGVAIVQSLFTYVTASADGQRATRRGRATEIFVRQGGQWVNPFWYLQ